MDYRRVLYTKCMTKHIQSKLRIVSYDKQRACKKNMYFVSFASDADMRFADHAVKRLRDVTLKPIQQPSSPTLERYRISTFTHRSLFFFTTLLPRIFSNRRSTCIAHRPTALRWDNRALEARAPRLLDPCQSNHQSSGSSSSNALKPRGSVTLNNHGNLVTKQTVFNGMDKTQVIDNIRSCVNAVETARNAADKLYHRYGKLSLT